MRSVLFGGVTDPPNHPGAWYCKYIGKRTIERLSANKEELTS